MSRPPIEEAMVDPKTGQINQAWATWATNLSRKVNATRGVTDDRPDLGDNDIGYVYFDTTLATEGQPIFWTGPGGKWVDYTGTEV